MDRKQVKRGDKGKAGGRFSRRAVRIATALLGTACLVITACSKTAVSAPKTKARTAETEYTQGQIRLIAATERNRYQNVYSSRLWSVTADGAGNTFEEKLKAQMGQFLVELTTINLMAGEQGIELTGQEKDGIKTLAQEYYHSLTDGDKEYMDVTQDEVYDLYCRYFLADKLVTELIEDKDLEVSDAEAKVIEVQQMAFDTREEAEAVLAQLQEEPAGFSSIASKHSKDGQILFSLEWKEDMDSLEQCAFSLEQDEISGIAEQDGKYYIQKCVNAYDQEATAARKSSLAQEKKTRAFRRIYEPFAGEYSVKLAEDTWNEVDFSQGEGCTSDDFFELYHSYFSK